MMARASLLIAASVAWVGGCDRSPAGSTTITDVVSAPAPSTAVPKAAPKATVESDEDCRAARACADFGACSFRDGRCIATADPDCKRSSFCGRAGRCKAHEGTCVIGAESDADCRRGHGRAQRNPCLLEGRCTAQDGVCVAATDEDCLGSKACAQFAACTAVEGKCTLVGEEDCKRSEVCTVRGLCDFVVKHGQKLCSKPGHPDGGPLDHGH